MSNAEPLAVAAQVRAHRTSAAVWLSRHSLGVEVAWPDLAALPEWAWASAEYLDALALHVGAWRHADTLRRCIDGRTHEALRRMLGEPAFAAMMADAPASSAPELPTHWPLWLPEEGQGCLLASIERPRLRLAVHRTLWPNLKGFPPPGMRPAEAWALVQRAFKVMPPGLSPRAGDAA